MDGYDGYTRADEDSCMFIVFLSFSTADNKRRDFK